MSIHLSLRRVLIAITAATAVAIVVPAAALATIAPTLTLNQSAGTAAGSQPDIGFDVKFNPTSDSPKNVTEVLPPGLLADATINGGACLASSTPTAACQVGAGTVSGGVNSPIHLYLVKAPNAGDLAGEALVAGTGPTGTLLGVADVTLRPSGDPAGVGLNVAFSNLPNVGISELNVTVSHLRMPTSCPIPAAKVKVLANSYNDATFKPATAPLTVTACSSVPYAPHLTATGVKDASDPGVQLTTTINQASNEAATLSAKLAPSPATLSGNAAALVRLNSTTPVGTSVGVSPLIPVPLPGKVYLRGTVASLQLVVQFDPPFALQLVGTINFATNSVTFNNEPDSLLTKFVVKLNGGPQALYTTSCAQPTSQVSGNFTGQNGKTVVSNPTLTVQGCVGSPTISGGSLSGLAKRKAKLSFTLRAGQNAPKLSSFKLSLPKGLSFIAKKHLKGLSLSGASIKSAKVTNGKLIVTLKSATASLTATLKSKLLKVSKGLSKKVKKGKVKSLKIKVTVTDTGGKSTPLTLKIKNLK